MKPQEIARVMSIRGTAASIQSRKVTEIPALCKAPRAIAFGGVPTGVPMPPTFAATGIDRAMPVRARPSGRPMMTGIMTANMVAVVAVLDMNMLSMAVMTMRPRTVVRAEPVKGLMRTAGYYTFPMLMGVYALASRAGVFACCTGIGAAAACLIIPDALKRDRKSNV